MPSKVLLKFWDGEVRDITDLVESWQNKGYDAVVAYKKILVNGQPVPERTVITHRNASVEVVPANSAA